jgi:hypothetical protein
VRWTTRHESHAGSWRATWDPRHLTGGDGFSRNSLGSYRQPSDGGARWTLAGGTLVGSGPAIQSVLVRKDAIFADGWVETVSSRADDGGLVLRVRDNGDYYLLAFRDDQAPEPRGTLNLAIYHHVGTAYHEMWSTGVAWPRGSRHTIRFEAVDQERRGEVQATARANDPAPYTGPGRVGLRHYGDDPGWVTRFDSFRWQAGFD